MCVDNIFDDELSKLSSIPYELQGRIIALQLEINDLIQNQTNHLVLKWLIKIFNAQLIECKSQLPVPDILESFSVIMCGLPLDQKRLIYLSSNTNAYLVSMLSEISGIPLKELTEIVALKILTDMESKTNSQIEKFIDEFVFYLRA
jgi:hypothetical protein